MTWEILGSDLTDDIMTVSVRLEDGRTEQWLYRRIVKSETRTEFISTKED